MQNLNALKNSMARNCLRSLGVKTIGLGPDQVWDALDQQAPRQFVGSYVETGDCIEPNVWRAQPTELGKPFEGRFIGPTIVGSFAEHKRAVDLAALKLGDEYRTELGWGKVTGFDRNGALIVTLFGNVESVVVTGTISLGEPEAPQALSEYCCGGACLRSVCEYHSPERAEKAGG